MSEVQLAESGPINQAAAEHWDASAVKTASSSSHAQSKRKKCKRTKTNMGLRRELERAAVLDLDSNEIDRRACWFLVEADWIRRWSAFVASGADAPGPITTDWLLEMDSDRPKQGLEPKANYRAVNPHVRLVRDCIACLMQTLLLIDMGTLY
jgi:hypothetical protein